MRKKVIIFTALVSVLSFCMAILEACEITVDNDGGYFVMTIDKASGERKVVWPKKPSIVGKDPSIHANFTLHVQKTVLSKPERYSVEQTACSPSHKISLKVSDVLNGSFDSSLIRVTKSGG